MKHDDIEMRSQIPGYAITEIEMNDGLEYDGRSPSGVSCMDDSSE